ncbi:hypothetical protein GGTG_09660 [Gaeumannomyces tritici R3-111a-1]|uniref:Uncharacterized protein n=1 Tax=Gaeumannomyces tritici (strain R3-111a-1) TaxID=644352 RepID=J3P822_GAET3|nr:hypothetical protein GGTG_09660 [Gaeumannomyces tritici R3-111a-1]EJT72805.1 hypothetical protein GGTG_09660 [Gaeumannomyces tritici R3-111a-1]
MTSGSWAAWLGHKRGSQRATSVKDYEGGGEAPKGGNPYISERFQTNNTAPGPRASAHRCANKPTRGYEARPRASQMVRRVHITTPVMRTRGAACLSLLTVAFGATRASHAEGFFFTDETGRDDKVKIRPQGRLRGRKVNVVRGNDLV